MGRTGSAARGRVLDAGALVALERGDARLRALAADRTRALIVPAAVLAQVWRNGARQARLAKLVDDARTTIDDLDGEAAKAVGVLLGRSGTSDIADASVVLSARRHDAFVFTGDATDLRRIDPDLPIVEV